MSDDRADAERLDRLASGVLRRIDERERVRRRAATAVLTTVLVVAGAGLLGPALVRILPTGASGSGSGVAAGGTSAEAVRCHDGSGTGSRARTVPLQGGRSASAAIASCARASVAADSTAPAALASPSPTPTSGRPTGVACVDAQKRLQVFVPDAHPGTLCRRNGMVGL